MAKQELRFGVIGLGLMGREFGSAVGRWHHLLDKDVVPRITAVCDTNPKLFDWFESSFDTIALVTTNYLDILGRDDVDALYCAVPHQLHTQLYTDIIRAGKHLMGEKPFGIDLATNRQILAAADANPGAYVACSSEMPFLPGAQRILQAIRDNRFGRIIEVDAGFLHSSDLDPNKAINWKRMIEFNGEYGSMGDLGMHVFHIPLRAGWLPNRVHARLSNIVAERPNAEGVMVPCETWDNAILDCVVDSEGYSFPMTLRTYRIAPGETNTWYIRITGTEYSIEYSTKYPKTLRFMHYTAGQEQAWQTVDLGYKSAYPAITGGIFEFGFPDAILQMWAAFCDELVHGREGMRQPFYCATPGEAYQHHLVLTAALESHRTRGVISMDYLAAPGP